MRNQVNRNHVSEMNLKKSHNSGAAAVTGCGLTTCLRAQPDVNRYMVLPLAPADLPVHVIYQQRWRVDKFPARSRLYQRQILQPNNHSSALFKIYNTYWCNNLVKPCELLKIELTRRLWSKKKEEDCGVKKGGKKKIVELSGTPSGEAAWTD